jgi:hypothetical protein
LIALCSLALLVSCIGCPSGEWSSPSPAGAPPAAATAALTTYDLKLGDALMVAGGKTAAPALMKDTFGPGMDGTKVSGDRDRPVEIRYACKDVPEGDYCVGLKVLSPNKSYFGVGEQVTYQLELHHNDVRQVWTGCTEPLRPQNAAEKISYQVEVRLDKPVHLKPGDVLRLAWPADFDLVVGPMRLYNYKPAGAVTVCAPPYNGARSRCLYADWGQTHRSPDQIAQVCTLTNPGVLAHTYHLTVQARDYYMVPLMPDEEENLALQPGQSATRTYPFKPSPAGQERLTLVAESEGMFPALRVAKFYVQDRASGPRPNTYLSGPDWEMCYAPGVEPGDAPPAGAAWTKISVPSVQSNKETKKGAGPGGADVRIDHHCAWYRKNFAAPANIQGERIILKCESILSEAWFYVNGKAVGHELHGAQPFEVDITDGFKPGQPNELLIAVRDWLAYSPKNLERARNGEPLVVRQDLEDLATYSSTEVMGILKPLYLEARPAVSVDDVFIVPSVRDKTLRLKYRLINKSPQDQDVTVAPKVLDEGCQIDAKGMTRGAGGKAPEMFPPKRVTIQAGKTAELYFDASWKNPKLWWPRDPSLGTRAGGLPAGPHLYCLATTLQPASGAADCRQDRFGFRELWIDGYSWRLNGVRVKLRGSYTNSGNCCDFGPGHPFWNIWEPDKRLDAYWASQTDQFRNWGLDMVRTNFDDSCDMADEVGLMMKKQTQYAGFCQPTFTFNDKFWEGGRDTNVRQMNVSKNHPSVVYWEAGNETMWVQIFLGEVPKAFASHWQLKICQAMREFDLQKRPIDWDADSDLFGKWETHSLHYPRELIVYPDIPNSAWWGPWDGKTPIDYMFGPITLGKKPVNVGESFWLTPSLPYQPTILIGDQAYAGRDNEFRAWQDITRFFLDGYRDAEFTYMDTQPLLPPHDFTPFRPQVTILKQETSEFYGGRTLRRDVNIHNDICRAAELTVRWSLTADDGRSMVGPRTSRFDLDAGELKRWGIDVSLPRVSEPVAATWRVELLEGQKVLHADEQHWKIFPSFSVAQPPSAVALFDPVGQTSADLDRIGLKYTRVTDLAKVFSITAGRSLIIGKDAFKQAVQGAYREALTAFVRGGGKVVILSQDQAPDFLPVNVQLGKGRKTTMTFVRAGDHPVMRGLADEDMRWWADDHYVADGNYQKPTHGRWLPLVDVGTPDGMTQSPLFEMYDGKGSFILCQMLLTEKALVAPQAGRMLQNLLDYLAAPGSFRTGGRTALLAGAASALPAALTQDHLEFTDLNRRGDRLTAGKFDVAIVDVPTALDDATAAALQTFAQAGGHVLLHKGTPEKQALLEKLLGARLRFFPLDQEPQDIQNHVVRMTDSGLLAGISNHDLAWLSPKYLSMLRCEGNGSSNYDGGCPPQERVADYFCWPADDAGGKLVRLTRPGAILQTTVGKGYIVLSQLRFDQPIPEVALVAQRLRGLLLTNLGCQLKGDGDAAHVRRVRLRQYQYATVDLSAYTNRGLKDDKEKNIVGWSNQGENDVRELPTGMQTFAGVPFQIAAPRCAIALYSTSVGNSGLPRAVKGIKIGQRADALFFMHDAAYGSGKCQFRYVVHYEDGGSVEVPIMLDEQVSDWWLDPGESEAGEAMVKAGAFLAWKGQNPMTKAVKIGGVGIWGYEWANPHPEKLVMDIDFQVPDNAPYYQTLPLLVAITAATMQADEGIVTGVIDTRGIKVKLGTQEKEIYYIGVGGIEKNHPYYAAAVEAHKAMVLGRSVKIVYDVVRQNNAGQSIAYVYLGGDTQAGNLVNGKVLADGLAKLGEFEGNDRLRMYLINVGEPAKWRKVGMWGEGKK